MAWTKSTTTKHTCGGPVFGKLAKRGDCPRCDELRFGAPAVKWKESADVARCRDIRAHLASDRHLRGLCGPVCTFGEW